MSVNVSSIRTGQEKWWRENIFPNGDFSNTTIQYANSWNEVADPGPNRLFYHPQINEDFPVIGQYMLWQNKPTTGPINTYINFGKIAVEPLTTYTLSWWERHIGGGQMSNSRIDQYVGITRVSTFPVEYALRFGEFYKVSFTFKTTNATELYIAVILGTKRPAALHCHTAYDGVYLCKGTDTPYHWTPKLSEINTLDDYIYWKNLDTQNKMYHDLEELMNLRAYRTLESSQNLGIYKNSDVISSTSTYKTVRIYNDNVINF
ncbi:MAG: hypothetical protein LIO93_04190 [Bacteroidales bacterium]|nr:hypothetical protein [Bacteroidales bacterium]